MAKIYRFRKYVPSEEFVAFNSQQYQQRWMLSNFAEIEGGIELSGIKYPSVEHAYQAHKFILSDRERFSIDGDFLGFPCKGTNAQSKYMGLEAKRASMRYKQLGLTPIGNDLFQKHNMKLMYTLLSIKFRVEKFRKLLLSTNDAYLLEIPPFPGRKTTTIWCGNIVDNKLVGKNALGNLLMLVRSEIRKSHPDAASSSNDVDQKDSVSAGITIPAGHPKIPDLPPIYGKKVAK